MVLIKRIEICIEMMKMATELVVVVAEAVRLFLTQVPTTTHPALFHHRGAYYSASSSSSSSPYIIGYL
ncbi:unnamed protein product [Cochlearia groenlandica]